MSEWFEKHRGKYVRTEAETWHCDDECGCTQARVMNVYMNRVTGNSYVFELVWEGEFHTEWETGADDDLVTYREELRKSDPDFEERISWQ